MANHVSHGSLPYPIKNARYTILVPYLDADGDPTDPTTPDTEVSQDGGAYADAAEEMTTISGSNGTGYITLSGAETNNSLVAIAAKVASGPKNTLATLYPRNLAILSSGTLSAGSAGGGTLGTVLAYDIQGAFIRTTGGTGGGGTGGANNQARRIVTYTIATGAFTVTPNWETTPDNTTTYDVLLPEGITAGIIKALNPTTAGRTLDVSTGGEAGLDWANVGSPTTTNDLSGTTIKTTQKVDIDTIKTNPVVNGGTITFPTNAMVASTTNVTGGTITTVTNLTNAPTNGDLTATMKASVNTETDTALNDYDGPTNAELATALGTADDATLAAIAALNNLSQANIRTAVGLASANLDTQLDALPTANENADALLDRSNGVETSHTLRQSLRLMLAALAGKLSGAATTTVTIRDVNDSKNRITATVDSDGNRTAITEDVS